MAVGFKGRSGVYVSRLSALPFLAVLVLACGRVPGAPPPASVVPSASQASAASPGTQSSSFLTIEQAASAYEAVAEAYNTAIDRAHELYGSRQSLKDHQRYWGLIAQADDEYIDGLRKIAFPPELQVDATVLIKADVAFQQRALAASRARSLAEVISLSAAANDASDAAADKAAILREGLGLTPNS